MVGGERQEGREGRSRALCEMLVLVFPTVESLGYEEISLPRNRYFKAED